MKSGISLIISYFVDFFSRNFPSWELILYGGHVFFAWSGTCLYFAGYLKRYKGWKTGYTRKVFHFLTFFTAAGIHVAWGTSAVCLFGGMSSLVIFYALIRGRENLLYEAMAREKDEPHRTFYIVVPYFSTLIGGLAANIMFGRLAIFGYLVTGIGDAIGEPVGTLYGSHRYKVFSFGRVPAVRSIEGSLAVFLVSAFAMGIGIAALPTISFSPKICFLILMSGMVCSLVEAVSPHGLDNFTLQIIPAILGYYMF